MTVLERLKMTVAEMERGDWAPVSAAVLVTRDTGTGILTFVNMSDDIAGMKNLLGEAAKSYGYEKVN